MNVLPLSGMAVVVACAAVTASAQENLRQERVRFAPGLSSATVQSAISGYETIDYLVQARAGQTMVVTLATDHTVNYFNVIPPDAENEADFVGSTEGRRFQGMLDLDGDWRIRVYLMRAAARRGEAADYTLTVEITGEPDPAMAREANDFGPRRWDARGDLGCAWGGEPMRPAACPFKVIRYQEGATIFVLARPMDRERILYFEQGAWSTPSSEGVQALKRTDMWYLVVGDEAYEVPDAVLFGG